MAPYEIAPQKDGTFDVKHDGKSVKKGLADRAEAIEAAKEARGDVYEELFSGDGASRGVHVQSRGPEAIVLLTPDGDVYGELDHEVVDGGSPQEVAIQPASEVSEA
jgi:hypothetical protein